MFPPFVALFISFNALLHQKPVIDELKDKFLKVNKAGIIVWPIANLFQFRFVPSTYRVLYVNCIGIGWNTYLSLAAH